MRVVHAMLIAVVPLMTTLLIVAVPCGAAEPERERAWEVELTPFLWMAGMQGQIDLDDTSLPVGVGFLDILESLKGTAMVDLSLRYGRVGVVADGIWLRVDSTHESSGGVFDEVKVVLNSAFGTGAAFFRFEPTKGLAIDPYVGARWWRLKTEAELSGCLVCPFSGEDVVRWADPVFGFRLHYDITDRWFVRAIGDVGGGVSKYQWQAIGATGYRFTDWLSLHAGYRINGVKYEDDGFVFDMNVSGLVMGVGFRY